MTYLVANWHLLINKENSSDNDFWLNIKSASCLMDEQPRVYTDKDKRIATTKESMMRALTCELERI